MMTVYYHGYPELQSDLPDHPVPAGSGTHPEPGLIDLPDAVRILSEDTAPAAGIRRRRAVVKLAGGLWQISNTPQASMLSDALEGLGAPIGEIESVLKEHPPQTRQELEVLVYGVLTNAGWSQECPAYVTSYVGYDWASGATFALSTIVVTRPLAEVARVLDPQNWAWCSIYFEKVFVAAGQGSTYQVDGNYDGFPANSPPEPGTTWNGVVFEHFAFSFLSQETWFRNFLDVATSRSNEQFSYDYRLHDSIRSKVPPFVERDGGLLTDEGFVNARLWPDGSVRVTASKVVKFDYATNALAQFFLLQMGDELADTLCTCQPPTTLSWCFQLLEMLRRWLGVGRLG